MNKDGLTCAKCPWYTFCRGCALPCDEKKVEETVGFCGIDWDPAILHLRYQYSEEKVCAIFRHVNLMNEHVFIIQSTPLNRVTSVRGHFAPIKRTLLTENILYWLLCMSAIPVLPKVARLSG